MIAIRREDKNEWERRAPLAPEHVRALVSEGLEVTVQTSPLRIFTDDDYREAGATVSESLSGCPVVFGVKEIPIHLLEAERTYIFFTHVIKGQPYNMGLLRRLLELKCTVVCYEKVVDDDGRRLVLFGRHAGLAGMIDSLWALGQRFEAEGIATPLREVKMAHGYASLAQAEAAITEVGAKIAADGLPEAIAPLTVGFAGYGNVSAGAQHILDCLPLHEVPPEQLAQAAASGDRKRVVKTVFKEEHMAVPRQADAPFVLQDYYDNPQHYRGVFARYLPHLSALINCIYWTPDYPRLVTRDLLHGLYGAGRTPKLRVIGDISCDIEGGVECTLEPTSPGDPVYVFLPDEDRIERGVKGHGPVVLAVDNLPCELPADATRDFGKALSPFVEAVARADYAAPFEKLQLPPPIKRAVVCHQGALTPDFRYLTEFLDGSAGQSA